MDINDNLDPSTDVASRAAFAPEGHQNTGAGKEIVSAESSGIEPGSSLFWLALGFLVKVTATLGGCQGTHPPKKSLVVAEKQNLDADGNEILRRPPALPLLREGDRNPPAGDSWGP